MISDHIIGGSGAPISNLRSQLLSDEKQVMNAGSAALKGKGGN